MLQLRYGTPEEAGMRPEAVGNIRGRAQQWVSKGGTPAVVLLAARRGVIFLHEAYGRFTPSEDSPKLPLDALFPLASLSKPITATALIILVEDGLVGLNRALQEYIPEFRGEGKEAVMVHHLLTHTSGLHGEDWEKEVEIGAKPSEIPIPDKTMHPKVNELLFLLYRTPLRQSPGIEMEYTDANYYLAGEIVRRVSGKSLEQFARERIFDPLGMDDSYFVVPTDAQRRVVRRPEHAPGYAYEDPEFMERPSPSAGAYSTAHDMAKFGQMFLNRGNYGSARVLSPAAVAVMTSNQIPGISADFPDLHFPEAGWGFGWSVAYPFKGRVYGEDLPSPHYFNHGGSGGVEMWVDPRSEIVGVYFSVALELDRTEYPIHDADLFMNMVTAGVDLQQGSQAAASAAETNTGETDLESRKASRQQDLYSTGAAALRDGTTEAAGVDPERLNKVIERAQAWVGSGTHPALVVLAARHGLVFLHDAFGYLGPKPDAPALRKDAIFPLASISKPITAAAAMILVEEGLLALNRPVQEYIPEFQGDGRELVSIRHLMTHTSGLREDNLLALAARRGLTANSEPSDENWALILRNFDVYLSLIHELAPSHQPDKRMDYSTCNYDLLAEVIGRVSGLPFADFVHQRLLEPLGMVNTYLQIPEQVRNRVVRRLDTAPYKKTLDAYLEAGPPSGGGGFFGTALDLAILGQMFLNGGTYNGVRILSRASTAAMTRDQIPGIEGFEGEMSIGAAEWGLGWSIHATRKTWAYNEPLLSRGSYCHGGIGGVFMWVDPIQDLVAVFLSTYKKDLENGRPDAQRDLFINGVLAAVVEE